MPAAKAAIVSAQPHAEEFWKNSAIPSRLLPVHDSLRYCAADRHHDDRYRQQRNQNGQEHFTDLLKEILFVPAAAGTNRMGIMPMRNMAVSLV